MEKCPKRCDFDTEDTRIPVSAKPSEQLTAEIRRAFDAMDRALQRGDLRGYMAALGALLDRLQKALETDPQVKKQVLDAIKDRCKEAFENAPKDCNDKGCACLLSWWPIPHVAYEDLGVANQPDGTITVVGTAVVSCSVKGLCLEPPSGRRPRPPEIELDLGAQYISLEAGTYSRVPSSSAVGGGRALAASLAAAMQGRLRDDTSVLFRGPGG
jgi:hypothetical protein